MLKSFTVLPFLDHKSERTLRSVDLNEQLVEFPIADPTGGQTETIGFSCPCEFTEDLVFTCSDGTRMLNVEIRARVLPANVVKKRLREGVEQFVARMGRKPSRKELRSLKEDIVATMLPNAFIRATHVPVLIKTFVLIGTSSPRLAEEIAVLLRSAVGYEELQYGRFNRDPETWMTRFLRCDTYDPTSVVFGASALLKRASAVVRLKDTSLESAQVGEYLTDGFTVREMALEWQESVKFVLTDKLVFKGIKFNDVTMRDAKSEDDAGTFDGTVAIVTGTLDKLITQLVSAMPKIGGDEVPMDDEL